jgi:ribosomal-protein-alanine N-acetyltransferase
MSIERDKYSYYLQESESDCGPAAVATVIENFLKVKFNSEKYATLARDLNLGEDGVRAEDIVDYLSKIPGLSVSSDVSCTMQDLERETGKGNLCLVAVQNGLEQDERESLESGHYAVVVGVDEKNVYMLDPTAYEDFGDGVGWWTLERSDFESRWIDFEEEMILSRWMLSVGLNKTDQESENRGFSKIKIVDFKEEGFPKLLELERKTFPKDFWSEKDYRKELASYPSRIRLVRDGDNIMASFYNVIYNIELANGESVLAGEVASISVDEKYRRKGLGEFIFKEAIKELREMGAPRIIVHMRIDNYPIQNLATKLGFHTIGIIDGYYGDTKAIQMELI